MAWEYIVVHRRMDRWVVTGMDHADGGTLIELLNELGAEGWELATAMGDTDMPRFYMKRASS